MLRIFIAALFAYLFFLQSAYAQYMPPPLSSTGYINAEVFGETWEEENAAEWSRKSPNKDVPKKRTVEPDASELTYSPSSSLTRTNLQNFVEKSRAIDPAGAAQLEELFASEDVMGSIGSAMRSVGLDKNNVADAYALYWVNAWSAAYADFNPTSRATAKAVARQAAVGLSQSSEFARASDAQKQEMAEALMIQGALIEAAMQGAKDDPELLRKVGAAVMQGAKATGLELDRMTLTENGFVPSNKGSDANAAQDAADPAAADKALAANNDGEDSGLSVAQIAMIAAAGGAGLGAVLLLGRASGRNS